MPRDAAVVDVQSLLALDDQIAADLVIVAAAEKRTAAGQVNQVREDVVTGVTVIHVHGVGIGGMVDEIASDDIASGCPVQPTVEPAEVAAVETDVVDLVALQHVVVAAVANAAEGQIVQQIAGDAIADAFDEHRIRRAQRTAAVMDVVVPSPVPGGRERRTVAARQMERGGADRIQIATLDRVTLAGNDVDAAAHVANGAAGQTYLLAAVDAHGGAERRLDDQPLERHVRDALHGHQWLVPVGDQHGRARQIVRRPEVQLVGRKADTPLTRLIDLFEQVHCVPRLLAVAAPRAVDLGRVLRADAARHADRLRDEMTVGIDRLHANRLQHPRHTPKAGNPDALRQGLDPAAGPVATVPERSAVRRAPTAPPSTTSCIVV